MLVRPARKRLFCLKAKNALTIMVRVVSAVAPTPTLKTNVHVSATVSGITI